MIATKSCSTISSRLQQTGEALKLNQQSWRHLPPGSTTSAAFNRLKLVISVCQALAFIRFFHSQTTKVWDDQTYKGEKDMTLWGLHERAENSLSNGGILDLIISL